VSRTTGFLPSRTGPEAQAFIARGSGDAGPVAKRGEHVQQVGVALGTSAGRDAGTFGDEGHAPGVFVEILFPLQAVAADGHAVIGGVDDVRVFEFTHGFEPGEDAADLDVDGFGAGELAADFVADGAFVAALPDAAHRHLVADIVVAVRKRMRRQPVFGQGGLARMGGRGFCRVGVIGGAVVCEQVGFAVAGVVGMGEPVEDEKRVAVLGGLALAEVGEHLFAVPGAAGFVGAAALGGVAAHGEELVGGFVAVADLAGAHRVVPGGVEHGRHRRLLQIRRGKRAAPRTDRQVPDAASAHDHVPRRRADAADKRAHVIGAVEHHALRGEPVEVRRAQRGLSDCKTFRSKGDWSSTTMKRRFGRRFSAAKADAARTSRIVQKRSRCMG
jgi:hypothetical protein